MLHAYNIKTNDATRWYWKHLNYPGIKNKSRHVCSWANQRWHLVNNPIPPQYEGIWGSACSEQLPTTQHASDAPRPPHHFSDWLGASATGTAVGTTVGTTLGTAASGPEFRLKRRIFSMKRISGQVIGALNHNKAYNYMADKSWYS